MSEHQQFTDTYEKGPPYTRMTSIGLVILGAGLLLLTIGAGTVDADGFGVSWYLGLAGTSLGVTVTLIGVSIGVLVKSLKD